MKDKALTLFAILISFGVFLTPTIGDQATAAASTTVDDEECTVTYYGYRAGPLGCYGADKKCKEVTGPCDIVLK